MLRAGEGLGRFWRCQHGQDVMQRRRAAVPLDAAPVVRGLSDARQLSYVLGQGSQALNHGLQPHVVVRHLEREVCPCCSCHDCTLHICEAWFLQSQAHSRSGSYTDTFMMPRCLDVSGLHYDKTHLEEAADHSTRSSHAARQELLSGQITVENRRCAACCRIPNFLPGACSSSGRARSPCVNWSPNVLGHCLK